MKKKVKMRKCKIEKWRLLLKKGKMEKGKEKWGRVKLKKKKENFYKKYEKKIVESGKRAKNECNVKKYQSGKWKKKGK